MKHLAVLALLLLTAVPAPAGAGSTWSGGAADDTEQAAQADDYDKAMSDGDDEAMLASSESSSPQRLKKLVLAAVADYERAAAARPDLAEPHWRAANMLYGFFYDCDYDANWGPPLCQDDSKPLDAKLARRLIGHWDAIERIDPLDPRLGAQRFDPGILFHRAIMRTKLGTDDDMQKSIVDYESWLARSDSKDVSRGLVLGNLAEGYMMTGDLDRSIIDYREALTYYQETSLYYGLAAAYDRDGQGAKAREIIAALGDTQFQQWYDSVYPPNGDQPKTFYVPDGEVYYYLGLAREALGKPKEAIADYKSFIKSGAHPMYQARAQENIDALTAKQPKAK